MSVANWGSQCYNVIQSLLFNNPNRVIAYRLRDDEGSLRDRSELPAPVRRLYETEAPEERTCLETIQFVPHVMIPPGERHVAELHVHPDAEELVVVTCGQGSAHVGGKYYDVQPGDVVHIPTGAEHEVRNTGDDFFGLIFINVPTGDGLTKLLEAQK